jgi:DNA-binding NarL/FixJ family response regulator
MTTTSSTSKFIVADDHPLFREALSQSIHQCVDNAQVVTADSLASLQAVVEKHADADLLLLDLHMPGVQGFSALVYLSGRHETLPTVIVSASEDPAIMRRALELGASGYIPKSSPIAVIGGAIRAVLDGEVWLPDGVEYGDAQMSGEAAGVANALATLTPHQFRVLQMLGEGLMNKQIAYQLGVSEATIKAHVTAVLRKLNVTNRTQAVVAISQLNIDDPSADLPAMAD